MDVIEYQGVVFVFVKKIVIGGESSTLAELNIFCWTGLHEAFQIFSERPSVRTPVRPSVRLHFSFSFILHGQFNSILKYLQILDLL